MTVGSHPGSTTKAAVYVQGESGDLPMGTSPSFYRTLTHRASWILDKVQLWQRPTESRTAFARDIQLLQSLSIPRGVTSIFPHFSMSVSFPLPGPRRSLAAHGA